jgi:hypothetical protein
LKALETDGKVEVTKENAGSISVLMKEFWLEDLLAECFALQMALTPELIAALYERIYKIEGKISSYSLVIIAELKEPIANHERLMEISGLRRISALEQ